MELTNTSTDPTPGGTGHGITGMRERALALGGTFEAKPQPAGGFAVRAWLPVADDHRQRSAG